MNVLPTKVAGLDQMSAIYDSSHFHLNENIERPSGPNIGRNGENLTISFLSLGRVHLSEKLCRSINEFIPEFAGEVLVIDNGSSETEIETLTNILAGMRYRSRIVRLGQNFGVAGGRNRTIEHVQTEWLMCLDNDIYFIANPLQHLQWELGVTGCHFMSMPLMDPDRQTLFALGGHLYLNADADGRFWLGAGSAYQQDKTGLLEENVFLGTFLFGGSSILKVESFQRLGGYDEAMFIGFEDLDFSVRIFRSGMKVGCSGLTALVHDHPPAQNNSDADYERTRFSRQIIEKSAKHLQEKYGFSIWSDVVEQWLERQADKMTGQKEDLKEAEPNSAQPAVPRPMRVALVVDSDDWAFANISRQIVKALGHRYQFEIIPHTAFDNYFQLLAVLDSYDFVHIFWREVLAALDTPYNASYAGQLGCDLEMFLDRFFRGRPVTTAVYDHLFLKEEEVAARSHIFSQVTGYTVSSKRLGKIYETLETYPKPAAVFPDGVDLDLFTPVNLERFGELNTRPIVVGWVGNSKWSEELGDIKGVNTILKPALEQLRAEGLEFITNFADRQDQFIPHHKMPAYYHTIDLYICTSEIEGTPNPVMEAMASGVPVISTDVGLVPELFGPLQREFILRERSVDALKDSLRRLHADRSLFARLSEENLTSIKPWDWKNVAPRFDEFLSSMVEKHRERYTRS